MNIFATIGVLGVGLALTSAYYFLGSFTYLFEERSLIVRRRVFGGIPFGSRVILFTDVKEVRRFGGRADLWRGADVYGRLFLRPGVVVILKQGITPRIYLTPSQPDEFIRKLKAACSPAS